MFHNKERLGLALSGGGIRAAVFHLGVMKFLAQTSRLEQVTAVSSVSGASLCIGLILSENGYKWPSSAEYLQKVLPACERTILSHNIEKELISRKLKCIGCDTVSLLAKALEQEWGVYGNLQDIPSSLRWEINCVAFETAESFRFSQEHMGGPKLGYAMHPVFPVANAAAASAAFPVLIGTYLMDMRPFEWYPYPSDRVPLAHPPESCRLWDGGIYDNLGLEPLYRPGCGIAGDIDFLIVSDASSPVGEQDWSDDDILQNLLRIWDIKSNESDSLLIRNLFIEVISKCRGAYMKSGSAAEDILRKCCIPPNIAGKIIAESMTPEEAAFVGNYPTTLSSPCPEEFALILRHGYETALCVSRCERIP